MKNITQHRSANRADDTWQKFKFHLFSNYISSRVLWKDFLVSVHLLVFKIFLIIRIWLFTFTPGLCRIAFFSLSFPLSCFGFVFTKNKKKRLLLQSCKRHKTWKSVCLGSHHVLETIWSPLWVKGWGMRTETGLQNFRI